MPDEEILDPPKKKIKFDKDGLPIPQNIRQSVQLDEEGLPIPLQKKNGISNGLTNGEDVATTSVPSTYPLPVNDPFSFDKFIPQKIDNAQEVVPSDNTHDTSPDSTQLGFDRFIPKKLDNRPVLASTLIDATSDDSNRSGYMWNKLLTGIGSMGATVGDWMFQLLRKVTPDEGISDEEALKKFRAEGLPTIRTGIKELAGAAVTPEQQQKYEGEFLTSAVGNLIQSVPAIATTKGAGIFLQAYDGGLQMTENSEAGKNLPENVKSGLAVFVGSAGYAWEKAGLDKIFGKQSSKAASNLAIKTLSDLVKKSDVPITAEAFDQAFNVAMKDVKKQFVNAGGKIGRAGAIEFATGSAQEASNILAETLTNVTQGKQIFDETSLVDKVGRVLYSGAQEAVGGGILGTASIPFSTRRNYIAEKVSTAQTPEDIANLKTELLTVAKNKNLSEPETQQLNATIDDYVRVNQKIPIGTEARKDIAEKIIEREDIENEVTKKLEEVVSVDEAFKPAIREESEALRGRVEEINEEIKNLASPIDTKLSVPIEGVDEQGISIGENVPTPTENISEETQTEETKVEEPVNQIRSIEDIDSIIQAPVPTGKLKRMEVKVKSIDPETNEVTLKTWKSKDAIVNLKRQISIIDLIKKCL